MTYYVYDSKGYIGDLASGKGLSDLRIFSLQASKDPEVKAFFNKGISKSPLKLQSEFKALNSSNASINETIQNLIEMLGKCKDVAIISNGGE